MYLSLNQKSRQMIDNVYRGFKTNYPQYVVEKVGTGNIQVDGVFLNVYSNEALVNSYLFSPGINGEIESIAIYGQALQGHYNTISRSRNVFGLPVDDISIDNAGLSPYVDIIIGRY